MEYNFVVILKTGQGRLKSVRALSSFEPTVMVSDEGWLAVIGDFKEADLTEHEYYPATEDWQTLSGWMDLPL